MYPLNAQWVHSVEFSTGQRPIGSVVWQFEVARASRSAFGGRAVRRKEVELWQNRRAARQAAAKTTDATPQSIEGVWKRMITMLTSAKCPPTEACEETSAVQPVAFVREGRPCRRKGANLACLGCRHCGVVQRGKPGLDQPAEARRQGDLSTVESNDSSNKETFHERQ